MLEKPKRAKQLNNQDRQLPATIQELINRYDLENKDIYKFLDYLVDNINNKTATGEGSVSGDTLPIGAIIEWNSDIIPENWLLCNGQAVNREEYSELFEILGVAYGEGDGSTTFNLPNYKGRVAVGKDESDTDFNTLGKQGGEKKHTLTTDEMPKHGHNTQGFNRTHTGISDGGESMSRHKVEGDPVDGGVVLEAGGDQPHNNLQPYIITNFIIKAKQSSGLVATVIDSLKSNSSTDGLSANQGRILNNKISKNILWENNNVTSEFPAQTITLKSSDYDYVIIYAYRNYLNEGGGDKRTITCLIEKNSGGEITFSDYLGQVRAWNRRCMISNDTKVAFYDSCINENVNNITLIPYKILGCKY